MKLVPLVVVLLTGCIESNLIPCGELQCPSDATCHQGACVATVALDACAGIADGTACTLANSSNSICLSSVCTAVGCGTGVIDPRSHEVCADTNRENGDGCNADCTSTETCGNGVIDQYKGEACDDGNASNDDDCHNDCRRPSCGDGVVDSRFGEACDDGATNSDQANANCRPNCLLSRCGDGTADGSEVCDDRNANSGDGCSFDCKSKETCGNNYTDFATGEQCDNDTTLAGDGCGQTCENEQLVVEPIVVDPLPTQYCSHDFPARGEYVVFSNVGTVIVGRDGRHVRITHARRVFGRHRLLPKHVRSALQRHRVSLPSRRGLPNHATGSVVCAGELRPRLPGWFNLFERSMRAELRWRHLPGWPTVPRRRVQRCVRRRGMHWRQSLRRRPMRIAMLLPRG